MKFKLLIFLYLLLFNSSLSLDLSFSYYSGYTDNALFTSEKKSSDIFHLIKPEINLEKRIKHFKLDLGYTGYYYIYNNNGDSLNYLFHGARANLLFWRKDNFGFKISNTLQPVLITLEKPGALFVPASFPLRDLFKAPLLNLTHLNSFNLKPEFRYNINGSTFIRTYYNLNKGDYLDDNSRISGAGRNFLRSEVLFAMGKKFKNQKSVEVIAGYSSTDYEDISRFINFTGGVGFKTEELSDFNYQIELGIQQLNFPDKNTGNSSLYYKILFDWIIKPKLRYAMLLDKSFTILPDGTALNYTGSQTGFVANIKKRTELEFGYLYRIFDEMREEKLTSDELHHFDIILNHSLTSILDGFLEFSFARNSGKISSNNFDEYEFLLGFSYKLNVNE